MDIESTFDRSIASFFRLLKDHVNDSVLDFLIYLGFTIYNFIKLYSTDKEAFEGSCSGFSGLSLPCFLFYSRISRDHALFFSVTIIIKSITQLYRKLSEYLHWTRLNYQIELSRDKNDFPIS